MPVVAPMRASAAASSRAGSGSDFKPADHANAAGRAARPAAAYRSVRDAVGAQRFEHRRAGQHRHGASTDMGQMRLPADAVDDAAYAARGERQHDKAGIDHQPDQRHAPDLRVRLRRFAGTALDRSERAGCLRFAQYLVPAGNVAGECERRDQDADRPQDGPPNRIPALGAKPKMQADAGVRPQRQHRGNLQVDQPWCDDPMVGENRMIAARGTQEMIGDFCANDVQHDQWRDRKPENDLRKLPDRQPQITADKNRPQRIQNVNRQGRGQQAGSDTGPPEHHQMAENFVGNRQRHDQEDVAHEVAEHEREQHQAANEARARANEARNPGQSRSASGPVRRARIG